jgi:Acetyltransferase (GNAT) domain
VAALGKLCNRVALRGIVRTGRVSRATAKSDQFSPALAYMPRQSGGGEGFQGFEFAGATIYCGTYRKYSDFGMPISLSGGKRGKAMFSIRYFPDFSVLPSTCVPLLESVGRDGLFGDPEWFAYLMRRMFDASDALRLYVVEESASGRPLLLAPLRFSTVDAAVPGARVIGSISHPENYAVMALGFDQSVADPLAVLVALFSHLRTGGAGSEAPCDVLRLWPVEANSARTETVFAAMRRSGFWIQSYANSYNRFETTSGMSYEAYLAGRSANHRYNIRRRHRALEKAGTMELVLYRDQADLGEAVGDYVAVSMASWKSPPTMIAPATLELIELAARKGCLRLGILRVDGVAAAAQFWIVTAGVAHCARLAYREDYRQLAVGVVLTNFMIAHVLDQDHVDRIDFGYGDDAYKGGWMKDSRHYFGFMAFNPSTRRGRLQGLLHILGRPIKRAIKFLLIRAGIRRPDSPESS